MITKSITQRLLTGGLSATAGKLGMAISALLVNMLLARLLSTEAMGAYFLVSSTVIIGALLAQMGVHQAIVRLIAGSYQVSEIDKSRPYIKGAYLIVIVMAVLLSFIYAAGGGEWIAQQLFSSDLVGGVAVVTAIWMVLKSFQTLISQSFRGFHQIFYATLYEGLLTNILVLIGLFVLWVVWGESSLEYVIILTAISLCVTIMTGVILLIRYYKSTPLVKGYEIKKVMKISLPLFVATALVPCITEAHVWILGIMATEDEVAIYGAAFRVAQFVIMPLLIVNSVIPPMIAQLMSSGNKKKAEQILRATATVASFPSVIIVIMLGIFSQEVLGLMFGEFYEAGGSVLVILMAAQGINSLTGSPGVLLMMSDYQSIVMRSAIISAALGLAISFILVGSMGAIGVGFGVAASKIVHNLLMWYYCWKKLNIKTHLGLNDTYMVVKGIKKQSTVTR